MDVRKRQHIADGSWGYPGPDWYSQHASQCLSRTNQTWKQQGRATDGVVGVNNMQVMCSVHHQCYRHTVLQTHSVPHRQCYCAIQ